MAMSGDIETARDDLAYLRAMVSGSGRFEAAAGELFFWAGTLYGLQCLGHWLDVAGLIHLPPLAMLALAFGPTVLFIVVLSMVIWKSRKATPAGVASRALNAAFQGAGLANLVMAFVFAYGANKAHSMTLWLYHPVVVCMFQGVAWYVAWTIRREAWIGVVSLGWFVTTISCGMLVDQPGSFLLVLAIALLLLMAIPGYVMMRAGKTQA